MALTQRVETRVAIFMLVLLCWESACTVTTASTEEEFEIVTGAGGKYNANHAPVISRQVQSQLHHDVVRALRTAAQYTTFAALLDNMTESCIRQGITVFAPNNEALSNFQNRKTEERLEDVIRFHVVTTVLPFSNLLRLDVGSRLTIDVSNVTILVTNTTSNAYRVDDAVIVNPDIYTDATIAVHGINAVFNTSKITEDLGENNEPVDDVTSRPRSPFGSSHSHAFKVQVEGVPVYQILISVTVLYLLELTAGL